MELPKIAWFDPCPWKAIQRCGKIYDYVCLYSVMCVLHMYIYTIHIYVYTYYIYTRIYIYMYIHDKIQHYICARLAVSGPQSRGGACGACGKRSLRGDRLGWMLDGCFMGFIGFQWYIIPSHGNSVYPKISWQRWNRWFFSDSKSCGLPSGKHTKSYWKWP